MARAATARRKVITTAAAWTIGFLIFFPILWTILTSFKTEAQAISDPPLFLFFDWTLENYAVVQERSDYMRFLWNSVIIAGGSTLLGILIAVPPLGRWRSCHHAGPRTFCSGCCRQRCCRQSGVLYPISLIFVEFNLLDTRGGLIAGTDADQSADHRVDALHLFQGNPGRYSRSSSHGWRDAAR